MRVTFERERKGNLHRAAVYIDHEVLNFRNEVGYRDLEPETDYGVNWRLIGETGAGVKVTVTVEGVAKTLFEAKLVHADGGRQEDGKLFRMEGASQ